MNSEHLFEKVAFNHDSHLDDVYKILTEPTIQDKQRVGDGEQVIKYGAGLPTNKKGVIPVVMAPRVPEHEMFTIHRMASPLAKADFTLSKLDKSNVAGKCCDQGNQCGTGDMCSTSCCCSKGISTMMVNDLNNHFYHAHLWLLQRLLQENLKDIDRKRDTTVDPYTETEVLKFLQQFPKKKLPLCYVHRGNYPTGTRLVYSPDTYYDDRHPYYRNHCLLQPLNDMLLGDFGAFANCVMPFDSWLRCPFLTRAASEIHTLNIERSPPENDLACEVYLTLENYADYLISKIMHETTTSNVYYELLFEVLYYQSTVQERPELICAIDGPQSEDVKLTPHVASILFEAFKVNCDNPLHHHARKILAQAIAETLKLDYRDVYVPKREALDAVIVLGNIVPGDIKRENSVEVRIYYSKFFYLSKQFLSPAFGSKWIKWQVYALACRHIETEHRQQRRT